MFTAALFTIARTWKQPKCPSTDEWIKKMWHIYTMEYYSALKRNETELFVVRGMDLEFVIQSEVSQKDKNRASLVAQWLRICLLMQGTRVRALVWEDPTCHGAAGPVSHNC